MAALGVPLVCSVHSIVGLDFAASLMPGWQESIFPPYFVVGAMYSGFAMVVVLAAGDPLGPRAFRRSSPASHFEVMAKILLMASIVMGYSYATEWFMAWYGGEHADRSAGRASNSPATYAPLYWACWPATAVLPQALWFGRVRRSRCSALFAICDRDQHRHVARAHPDRLEHALARLHAEPVADVSLHVLGLELSCRAARPVRLPVPDLRAARPEHIDVRRARARPPGGRGMTAKLAGGISATVKR